MYTKYEDEHLVQKVAESQRWETPRGGKIIYLINDTSPLRITCFPFVKSILA
jgi:hypothetical protein